MIETGTQTERALLVGVIHRFQEQSEVDENLQELALLSQTAGAEVVDQVIQSRSQIDPAYYIGKGKANEIARLSEMLELDLVIFDDELSPAQKKNLQRLMKETKVIDRSHLILDIFARHARTRESKTQVELAQLEYILPRLTRQWTHLERQKGGIGTRGGMGETQIEVDRRLIRRRIANLKQDLEKISRQQETRRKNRSDIYKVALVGYTNAGKSSLMNLVSEADVYVEDKLFATLDTTVRKIRILGDEILLSDTVGFIDKLPHSLVASFRSTLQEALEADLILKVIDLSSPHYQHHLETVNTVLQELGIKDRRTLTIFNKIDAVDDPAVLSESLKAFPEAVPISVLRQINMEKLEAAIAAIRRETYVTRILELDSDQQKLLAYLHQHTQVLDVTYVETGIRVTLRARRSVLNQLKKQVRLAGED